VARAAANVPAKGIEMRTRVFGGVAGDFPAEGVAEDAKAAVARGIGSDPLAGQNLRGRF